MILTQEEFKQALKNKCFKDRFEIWGLKDKEYSDIMKYIVEENFTTMFFKSNEMSGNVKLGNFEIKNYTSISTNEFYFKFVFDNTKFFVDKIKTIQIFNNNVLINTKNSTLTFAKY